MPMPSATGWWRDLSHAAQLLREAWGGQCVLSSISESVEVAVSMLLMAEEDDDEEEELDDVDDHEDNNDEGDDTQIVEPWYPFPFTCSLSKA